MQEIFDEIERWRADGELVALATVVATRRSTPRPLGSKLAISEGGRLAGSVSGGCVEADVAEHAREVLAGAPPRLLTYGIEDEQALGVGLPCGGEIDVFLERLDEPFPDAERGVVFTRVAGDGVGERWLDEAADVRRTGLVDDSLFAEVLGPPPRLVVIGAVDIAEALCSMARTLGWRTVVVDPRKGLATRERIPSADELLAEWPEDVVDLIDDRTAVVSLAHEERIELPVLEAALDRGALYVGALGSRRAQEKRRARLEERGVAGIERIAGPTGLDLGAETPAEIALSILAEIVLRTKKGEEPEGSPPEPRR
jgi:xanthine dehydrogenase accessory factor